MRAFSILSIQSLIDFSCPAKNLLICAFFVDAFILLLVSITSKFFPVYFIYNRLPILLRVQIILCIDCVSSILMVDFELISLCFSKLLKGEMYKPKLFYNIQILFLALV